MREENEVNGCGAQCSMKVEKVVAWTYQNGIITGGPLDGTPANDEQEAVRLMNLHVDKMNK